MTIAPGKAPKAFGAATRGLPPSLLPHFRVKRGELASISESLKLPWQIASLKTIPRYPFGKIIPCSTPMAKMRSMLGPPGLLNSASDFAKNTSNPDGHP